MHLTLPRPRVLTRPDPDASSAFSALVFLLGLWLFVAPFVLDYTLRPARVAGDAFLVGTALLALGLTRALFPTALPWLSAVNAGLGLWLVLTPVLLDYHWSAAPRATINDVVVGLLVLVLAAESYLMSRRRRS